MSKKTTRKALLGSVLALVLCVAMLVGSTFAWFTDSVTSAENVIKSGTLDVTFEWADGTKEVPAADSTDWNDASSGAIFKNELWEPGYTEVRHIKIANEGSLALQYQLNFFTNGEVSKLADVIDVYYVDPATKVSDRTDLANAPMIGTLTDVLKNLSDTATGHLAAGEMHTVTLALKMRESAGNEYQDLSIGSDFTVQLFATQDTVEYDSFDNTYDKNANEPLTLTMNGVTVKVPASAPAGEYSLDVVGIDFTQNEDGTTTAKANITLLKDEVPVTGNGITYTVEMNLDIMSRDHNLFHNDEKITDFEYDPFTGVVSFETTSFSPFEVTYDIFGTGVTVDATKEEIYSGYFEGVNPATLDKSLLSDDSEYIAVDYVKNDVTCYAVSERATSVILDDGKEESYTFENGDYSNLVKTESSGKLYSIISSLQDNAHSTVYILPGTYEEGTTIYVYSSMDIVGLGNAGDIKVIKQSSSSSNRHLFNCNGTKEDYIEVSLRNMYLDATAKTTNSKDNAAVQSIRKSKVKCYDLEIVKGTGWDAVAFYVNGNNAVDGVKYPAYLYVENCTLNTTRTFGVVTTSGSYKFYHTGLTYNNGTAYTNNSGSIKNVYMDSNDWDWEN